MRKLEKPPTLPGSGEETRPRRFASILAKTVLLSSLVLGYRFDTSLISFGERVQKGHGGNGAVSQVDWKRTRMLIINGDTEERHVGNVSMAARAAIRNGAAGVFVAGVHAKGLEGVSAFDGSVAGVGKAIKAAGKESGPGDTIFLYITGHGDDGIFGLDNEERIGYFALGELLEGSLQGRNLVFVSDACYSAGFVEGVAKMRSFASVSAMSPGLQNETTSCTFFSEPFWHAVANQLDLDGNGRATLEEAFYFALNKYRLIRPETLGSYRASIQRISSLKDAPDGVVMVTSDSCPACKKMEPVFNTANMLMRGAGRFYMIDVEDEKTSSVTPTLIVMRGGKEAARSEGAMELGEFSQWLDKNGMAIKDLKVSASELFKQGKFESIVFIKDWEGMAEEMDADDCVRMLRSLLSNPNPLVRAKALERLDESATYIMDLGAHDGLMEAVVATLGEKDAQGFPPAMDLLREFAKARPEKVMRLLKSTMKSSRGENARSDAASALVYCSTGLGDAWVEKALISVLSDEGVPHEAIRNDIIDYFNFQPAPAVKALLRMQGSGKVHSLDTRERAIDALGMFLIADGVIHDKEMYQRITDALLARLADREGRIRAMAAACLGSAIYSYDSVYPRLMRLEKDADPEVALSARAGIVLLDSIKMKMDSGDTRKERGIMIIEIPLKGAD